MDEFAESRENYFLTDFGMIKVSQCSRKSALLSSARGFSDLAFLSSIFFLMISPDQKDFNLLF